MSDFVLTAKPRGEPEMKDAAAQLRSAFKKWDRPRRDESARLAKWLREGKAGGK